MRRPGIAAVPLLLAGRIAMAQAPIDFGRKLPAQVGDWKRPAAPTLYDPRTLYDYIDGGAELYISYGFRRVVSLTYSAGEDDEIKVDIFDMGSAADAFGVFAHGRESEGAEVGQGSEYASGLLTFWKDRYYVSVLGYPETDARRAAVHELGRAIARLIPRNGALPRVLAVLPRSDLVPASVRFFRHHAWQNDYGRIADENILDIGPDTQAALARYRHHTLLVVQYPAVRRAVAAEKSFRAAYLDGAAVAPKGEKFAGVRRVKRRVWVVLEAVDRETVGRVLAEAR